MPGEPLRYLRIEDVILREVHDMSVISVQDVSNFFVSRVDDALCDYRAFLQCKSFMDWTETLKVHTSAGGRLLNPAVLKRKDFHRTGKIRVAFRSLSS